MYTHFFNYNEVECWRGVVAVTAAGRWTAVLLEVYVNIQIMFKFIDVILNGKKSITVFMLIVGG